jgi:hypothetical protein
LSADGRLMLRACSLPLALARRNEGLVAAVERERVKVKEVESLSAEVARVLTAIRAQGMSRSWVGKKESHHGALLVPIFEKASGTALALCACRPMSSRCGSCQFLRG